MHHMPCITRHASHIASSATSFPSPALVGPSFPLEFSNVTCQPHISNLQCHFEQSRCDHHFIISINICSVIFVTLHHFFGRLFPLLGIRGSSSSSSSSSGGGSGSGSSEAKASNFIIHEIFASSPLIAHGAAAGDL